MPFNNTSKRIEALFAFVDEYEAGEQALRSGFDTWNTDLVASINAMATYLETQANNNTDQRYLGMASSAPTQRLNGAPLQEGDYYISENEEAGRTGLMYRWDGAAFVAVSDFTNIGAFFKETLSTAESQAAARGALGLGSAAIQNSSAFAPAGSGTDIVRALLMADATRVVNVITDWDAAHSAAPGTAFIGANSVAANTPAAANTSGLYVAYDTNNGFVLAMTHSPHEMFIRVRAASSWGPWLSLANSLSLSSLTLAAGDILYATGPKTLAKLAKGTGLQRLRMKEDASGLEYATEPMVRASAVFSSVPTNGTYTRTGNLVTVSMTAHGMVTGQSASLDFTSGTATDGFYPVTVIDANTFTVTDAASGATSGNVTRNIWMKAGLNIANIVRNGIGNITVTFATAVPDIFYAPLFGAITFTNHIGVAAMSNGVPTTTGFSMQTGNSGGSGAVGQLNDLGNVGFCVIM